MSIVQEDHKATLRKWHEDLQEKRGARASLRRSKTVNEACLSEGFHLLLMQTHSLWKTRQPGMLLHWQLLRYWLRISNLLMGDRVLLRSLDRRRVVTIR